MLISFTETTDDLFRKDPYMAYCTLIISTISLIIVSPLLALQIFVDPLNGDDRNSLQSAQDTVGAYKTIAHALAVAHAVTDSRPHIIELLPGKYSPSAGQTFPLEIFESGIHLRAIKNNGATVFDAEGHSNFFSFSTPVQEITIRGIDFYNGHADKGGFADCNTCSLNVVENRFFNNSASSNGHVIFSKDGRIRLVNNILRNNGGSQDTLGIIHLENKFDDSSNSDEIRNNVFYRNSSSDIWTSSTHLRVSGNIFISPGSSAIRNGSTKTTPFLDHNIFWQTNVLYVSPAIDDESEPDSIDVVLSVRDTLSSVAREFTLPAALKIAPNIKPLTFRSDSLLISDLSIKMPNFVTDFPDTLIKVGQTHQFLINVTGYPSAYQFKPLNIPPGLDTLDVRGQPRLLIWTPTANDVGVHPISIEITNSYGLIDTLSYQLSVFNANDFPDTSSFRSINDTQGRFTGMYRETSSHDVPITAGERYLFNMEVWGKKKSYEFNPLQLPETAFSTSVTQNALIDWTPTLLDTGRHEIQIEISSPSSVTDTLIYNLFVFEDHAFPDTSGSKKVVNISLFPDTTNGLTQLNNITPSFSSTKSAVGNLYADPVLLDTTYNRYELVVGKSPGINSGPGEVSFYDKNGTRNDIGYWGGPLNSGVPNASIGSEIELTKKPDSLLTEGQTFVYEPLQPNGEAFTFVDLLPAIPGADLPPTIIPSNSFAQAPPIKWIPTLADTGKYILGVKSYSADGSFGRHYFPIRVRPQNEIPFSKTEPDTSATEDVQYIFTIEAEDVDQDNISYELIESPENLSVDKTSGIVTWLPTQEQVGKHDIKVKIEDSRGATSDYFWSIWVQPSNDPPVIISQPDTVAQEDNLFRYDLVVSDPDPGDVFFPTLINGPPGVSIDSTGSLTWVPSQSQIGEHQIELIVRDKDDVEANQVFSVLVTKTNDPPEFILVGDSTITEDRLYEHPLIASDEDDENLTYTLNGGPDGMVLKDPNILSWLPEETDAGSHEINVSVMDPSGLSDTLSYRVLVKGVNDPPVITSKTPINKIILSADGTLLFRVNVEDEENDKVEYSWLKNGENIPNAIANSLAFIPTQNQLDSITVQIRDNQDTTSFTWNIDLRSMPRISLSDKEIDFSRVTMGDTIPKTVTITNTGDLTLELDSLQVGNPAFDASLSSLTLKPGEKSDLNLRFGPLDRGEKLDTVSFISNDPDNIDVKITTKGIGSIGTTMNFDLSSVTGDQKARGASLSGGQTVGLNIYAYDAIDLQSFQITLEFEASVLHFNSFTPETNSEPNILAKNGRVPTYKTEYQEDSSSITLSGSIADGGFSGDGLIGVVNFTVDSLASRGTTAIEMRQALIRSDQITLLDTVGFVSNAVISLRPKLQGDFDFDLDVDFDDFFIFSDSFGQENFDPLTDMNGDGEVSFDDFFLFSDVFGRAGLAKIPTHKTLPTKLTIDIGEITPSHVSLTPFWLGKEPTKGFVVGVKFDPDILRFERYVSQHRSPLLEWTIDSVPGQIILAVGTSSGQTPLQKLGKLEFVRLSNIETVLNPIIAIHYDGSTDPTYHTPSDRLELNALPMSFTLFPAHPNPFNPETTIEFYAPYKTNIDLAIYDLLGQRVRTLVKGEPLVGYHKFNWNGRNSNEEQVASGTYFVVMESDNSRQLQKLLLLK